MLCLCLNQPVGATENAAGQLGFATNTISLSTTPQVFNARIDSLNSYDMSNFNFLLTVVDTTGGTSAPSGVTIIEKQEPTASSEQPAPEEQEAEPTTDRPPTPLKLHRYYNFNVRIKKRQEAKKKSE